MRVKMQEMRIQAFKAYIQEVNNQNFPSKEFEVSVEDSVKTELIEYISKQNYFFIFIIYFDFYFY